MKKLHLEIDQLEVESFETSSASVQRGTVEAHVSPMCNTGGQWTCNGAETCGAGETCGGYATCYVTCHDSCPLPCDTYYC